MPPRPLLARQFRWRPIEQVTQTCRGLGLTFQRQTIWWRSFGTWVLFSGDRLVITKKVVKVGRVLNLWLSSFRLSWEGLLGRVLCNHNQLASGRIGCNAPRSVHIFVSGNDRLYICVRCIYFRVHVHTYIVSQSTIIWSHTNWRLRSTVLEPGASFIVLDAMDDHSCNILAVKRPLFSLSTEAYVTWKLSARSTSW